MTMELASAALISGFGLTIGSSAPPATKPPNIVIILSDDQGYADVSFNPAHPAEVYTPNIDALASSGVICTQGYVTGNVCSPTRAGLLTGRQQQRFGIYTAGQGGSGVPLDETFFPQHLKAGGYVSGAFGKWHLGAEIQYHAVKRGFDYFYGFMGRGAHDYWNHDPDADEDFCGPIYRNLDVLPNEEGYLTTLLTDEAVSFIQREKDRPFFAYVAYNAVHAPAQAPEEDIARYGERAVLMAMLYHLDLGVGRIVQALKDAGVYENTLVFYLSDNGGAKAMNANNAPLKGAKQTNYEGGIRVPFLVSWPAVLSAGGTCDVPVSSIDILATSLAAAGLNPLAAAKPLDGKNILPALKGQQSSLHDVLYWSTGDQGQWAIRAGDWKLFFDQGKTELYNLANDVQEATNLQAAFPERKQELTQLYNEWLEQMTDPVKGSRFWENVPDNIAAWDISNGRNGTPPGGWTTWTDASITNGTACTVKGITARFTGVTTLNSRRIDDGEFSYEDSPLFPIRSDSLASVYEDYITQLNGKQTLTLSALTPGTTYLIQFIGSFAREGQNLSISQDGAPPVNLISDEVSIANQVVFSSHFSFTATTGDRDVSFTFNRTGSGNANTQGISGMLVKPVE